MRIKIEVQDGEVTLSRTAEGMYGVWETAEENLGKLQRYFEKISKEEILDEMDNDLSDEHDCHASPEDGCPACDKIKEEKDLAGSRIMNIKSWS